MGVRDMQVGRGDSVGGIYVEGVFQGTEPLANKDGEIYAWNALVKVGRDSLELRFSERERSGELSSVWLDFEAGTVGIGDTVRCRVRHHVKLDPKNGRLYETWYLQGVEPFAPHLADDELAAAGANGKGR